jgi:uncharacterized Tic20 family protein
MAPDLTELIVRGMNSERKRRFMVENQGDAEFSDRDRLRAGTKADHSKNDQNIAVLITLSTMLLSVFSPLLAYFIFQDRPWIHEQMRNLLNFQITVLLCVVIGYLMSGTLILAIIGAPILLVTFFGNIIYLMLAAVELSHGNNYEYNWAIDLIK